MTTAPAIEIEHLWKRYGLPLRPALKQAYDRLRGRYNHAPEAYGPWALKDVSFSVKRGETLGIIGRNGAGKSTLLKVLAGVSKVTQGRIISSGRLFPMIELNAGMHPELTGMENIMLLGAIMGLSRDEMKRKLPQIAEFSELGDWLNQPVRKYSSGMYVRLGFAVAMNVDADILLIDEVLAVGDMAFRVKCYDHMERLRRSNKTILFVSHSIREVQRLCERAVLLNEGRVVSVGDADDVAADYYELSHDRIVANMLKQGNGAVPQVYNNTGQARITGIQFIDASGEATSTLIYRQPATLRLTIEVMQPIPHPSVTIGIQTAEMLNVAVMGFDPTDDSPDFPVGEMWVDCHFDVFPLYPGTYSIRAVLGAKHDFYKIDQVENMCHFFVAPDKAHPALTNDGGFIQLSPAWSFPQQVTTS